VPTGIAGGQESDPATQVNLHLPISAVEFHDTTPAGLNNIPVRYVLTRIRIATDAAPAESITLGIKLPKEIRILDSIPGHNFTGGNDTLLGVRWATADQLTVVGDGELAKFSLVSDAIDLHSLREQPISLDDIIVDINLPKPLMIRSIKAKGSTRSFLLQMPNRKETNGALDILLLLAVPTGTAEFTGKCKISCSRAAGNVATQNQTLGFYAAGNSAAKARSLRVIAPFFRHSSTKQPAAKSGPPRTAWQQYHGHYYFDDWFGDNRTTLNLRDDGSFAGTSFAPLSGVHQISGM
jgi:hypothetical protein